MGGGGVKTLDDALLSFDENGTPYSTRYGDVYHSADGALSQAAQVFLRGNELPERWRAVDSFVIIETGFGLGLNFLATWKAWREDEQACRELCYYSVEKHPLAVHDLARAHAAWHPLHALSARLLRQWPLPVPGIFRLELEAGLTLSLCFGDAASLLPALSVKANAFYLDGFSPSRNPELWTDGICRGLSRLAAPGATLATWTVAGSVRAALTRAGFVVEKREGFGQKRHRLTGVYSPVALKI